MNRAITAAVLLCVLTAANASAAGNDGWYTAFFASRDSSYKGGASADVRIKITIRNPLDMPRKDCPVVIPRARMPLANQYSECVTVVDPLLPPGDREENGAYLLSQLDDLDKDGVWDELFFQVDLKPRERKTVYVYIVRNMLDQSRHYAHAEIGAYGKHLMPWWETENIGWKLWYPDSCDMYGKRSPRLTANTMLINHYGHDTPYEVGADIMWVRRTFGAGGMCLFELPANPDSISRPRFSPYEGKGPYEDTRYAYDVVVNGPIRSMVRVHTMNWRTGSGSYEMEQYYTSYRNKNYYTCAVRFLSFLPVEDGVQFGCGIQHLAKQSLYYQKGGVVVTGTNDLLNYMTPNEGDPLPRADREQFLGLALAVKDIYKPTFHADTRYGENYTFRIPATEDLSYEFMAAGAWSDGAVLYDDEAFRDWFIESAREYNAPAIVETLTVERK